MKKRDMVFGLAVGLLGLLLAIGAQTFARPCVHTDGSAAMCAPVSAYLTVEGGLIAVLAGIAMLRPHPVLQGLAGAVGLLSCLTPGTLIPLCRAEAMRCRQVTQPTALVLGVLILAAALGWLCLTLLQRKREAHP